MEESPAPGIWDKPNEDHLRLRFPVHRACRDGDANALSGLLAHGEHDLYTEDLYSGWTPAHWAAFHGKLDCLQLLLTAGVNLDVATQRFHQTPAHIAAFGNQPHCLMWLIQCGASVDAQDYLGESLVHKAARCGGLECLGILKACGATFSIVNNNGHTAKDLASSCSNESCTAYIQQVEGTPHIANGFGIGHHCRKRGTDEVTNGDFKKPRIEENGSELFSGQHISGTENTEMTVTGHNGSVGCRSAVELARGKVKIQGDGQAAEGHDVFSRASPLQNSVPYLHQAARKYFRSSNGLSVSSVGGDSTLGLVCSSGIQATPTKSLLHISHPPQDPNPQKLQASTFVTPDMEKDFRENHSQQPTPMQTETQENNVTKNMDSSDSHNCATNENVAVSVSTSVIEHHATVAMTIGYNKLCESVYSTNGFCHFF